MLRLVVALLIMVILAFLFWLVLWVLSRYVVPVEPPEPDGLAGSAQWVEYYRRMVAYARRTGDEASAAQYESLQRMYEQFEDPRAGSAD